jgi:hypothetical protein
MPHSSKPKNGNGHPVAGRIPDLLRLAGVVVFLNEALLRGEMRPLLVAVSALAMAGGQGLDTVLDRLFGKP